MAAARESVQRLYAEIKQRLPFSLGKEKLFFGEYTCKRYMLRILFLKYSLNWSHGSKISNDFGVEQPTIEEYMRLQFISAKIDMLCDYFCELLSQLYLQNRTMRFFVYEKNYKFCDMNMRTYTCTKRFL